MADTDYFVVTQVSPSSGSAAVTLSSTTKAVHFWTSDATTGLDVSDTLWILEPQEVESLFDPNLAGASLTFTKVVGDSTVYVLEEKGLRA